MQADAIAAAGRSAWIVAAAARLRDWTAAERGRFALWLPLFMGAGVAAYHALRFEPPAWPALALLGVSVAAIRLARPFPAARAAFACLAAAGIGFASSVLATSVAPPPMSVPHRAVVVEGRVRAVDALPQGSRVTLERPAIDGSPGGSRLVRIRLRREDDQPVATGDTVRLRALLQAPSPPAYPGAWDLQRDAFFSGIGAYGFALGRAEILARDAPEGPARLLQAMREVISARIRAVLPDEDGAIAATLLTGNTAAIPLADRAAFRDSGLAHLLAIAGLHIGIVMALVFGATRRAFALSEHAALHWPCKQIAAVAALVAGGCYMLLTGAHVPIIRSFAMAVLVTLGVLAGRRALSLRGLALAAVAIVLIAPWEVMGVSFQMSFSAVLALIAGYEVLRPVLARLRGEHQAWRRFLHHLAALALTSAFAGSASAPFAAYHFGRIQIYFVLANMVAVPITAMLVMPAGLLAMALMPLHLEFLALVPMGWGIEAILWIGRNVAALPQAVIAVPAMPLWSLGVFAIGIAWLGIWRTRIRLAGFAVLAFGMASPLMVDRPDMLVSADAKLIALRAGPTLFVQSGRGASAFTRDAWAQMWAVRDVRPMPVAGEDCAASSCALRARDGGTMALLLRGPPPPGACGAPVAVSAEPIRLRCTPRIPFVDRFSVWRNGAHAIWLDPLRILSDRDVRGDRPWVPPMPAQKYRD